MFPCLGRCKCRKSWTQINSFGLADSESQLHQTPECFLKNNGMAGIMPQTVLTTTTIALNGNAWVWDGRRPFATASDHVKTRLEERRRRKIAALSWVSEKLPEFVRTSENQHQALMLSWFICTIFILKPRANALNMFTDQPLNIVQWTCLLGLLDVVGCYWVNIETAQNKRPTFPWFRGQPSVVQHCWVRLHRTPNNVGRTHAYCDNVSIEISVKT